MSQAHTLIDSHEVDALLREESLVAVHQESKRVISWAKVERCNFKDLSHGDWVVFHTEEFGAVMQQLSRKTAAGWVTSALHNLAYNSARVYPENFRGRVLHAYTLK